MYVCYDALAVDAKFAKKAEGWVSSCGDVTFWLELMAPSKGGPQFEPDRFLGLSWVQLLRHQSQNAGFFNPFVS